MRVIDITNPAAPTLTATCPTPETLGIAVRGSYAYLADGSHGMRVIDISNPSFPTLIATCATSYANGMRSAIPTRMWRLPIQVCG